MSRLILKQVLSEKLIYSISLNDGYPIKKVKIREPRLTIASFDGWLHTGHFIDMTGPEHIGQEI